MGKESQATHEDLGAQQRAAELAEANTALHRTNEHLRALTGRLFRLQDQERRQLARELHDGTTQNLIALAVNLASFRKTAPLLPAASAELVKESIQLIDRSIQELRAISYLLHPPLIEELGLQAALHSYVDELSARTGMPVNVEIVPGVGRMEDDLELGMFRIAQQALAGVQRHCQGRPVKITLSRSAESVLLEVADEGFCLPAEGLRTLDEEEVELDGMQERVRLLGGCCEIRFDGHCAIIRIRVPVSASGVSASREGCTKSCE